MNIIVLIYTLAITSFFSEPKIIGSNQNDENTGIEFFEGSWQEILEKAKEEDKLIFLDAYASWCGPCKAMQKKVFPGEKVGEYFNTHFINVKIDMEKGEGPALSVKYRVTAYPSLYFIDHTGKVVTSALGYHNVNKLLRLGADALKK